jgi:hypothetical protein
VASLPVTAGREIQIKGGASGAPPFLHLTGRDAVAGWRAVTPIDPDHSQPAEMAAAQNR